MGENYTPQMALERAQNGGSFRNDAEVINRFNERGISDVQPRINVLTFRAWLAKGRVVRKGEKGVDLLTWLPRTETVKQTDGSEREKVAFVPKVAYVFHISQTVELKGGNHGN